MRSAALLLVLAMLLGSTAIVFAGGGKSCCCLLKAGAMCPMRGSTAKMCGASACSMRTPDGWTLTARSMTAMPPATLVCAGTGDAHAQTRLTYAGAREGARTRGTQSPEPPPPKRA
jgi:hypothetical protein